MSIELPVLTPVLDAVFAQLTTLGLISDESGGLAFGTQWAITEFGLSCLRWIEQESASTAPGEGSPPTG